MTVSVLYNSMQNTAMAKSIAKLAQSLEKKDEGNVNAHNDAESHSMPLNEVQKFIGFLNSSCGDINLKR